MITREDINSAFKQLAASSKGVHGSAIILNFGGALRDYAEILISERDTALSQLAKEKLQHHAVAGSI